MPYKKTDFIIDLNHLLSGEPYNQVGFEGSFEYLAGAAFEGIHVQGTWYDGLMINQTIKRKSQQIRLVGKMWLELNQKQWLEPCEITITNKIITQQGISIKFIIGEMKVESDLDQLWTIN